jgi:hypothetical protein
VPQHGTKRLLDLMCHGKAQNVIKTHAIAIMHYILGQKDRKLGVLYYKQLKSYFHMLQRLFTHAIAIMQ